MEVDGKGSPWRHCRLVTSRHATWSCLLSVGNAPSTANLFHLVKGILGTRNPGSVRVFKRDITSI